MYEINLVDQICHSQTLLWITRSFLSSDNLCWMLINFNIWDQIIKRKYYYTLNMSWRFVIHIYKSFMYEQRESNRSEKEIMLQKRLNNSDTYICRNFTTVKNRLKITDFMWSNLHFRVNLGEEVKIWAPHIACSNCHWTLLRWTTGERSLKEPKERILSHCYFCTVEK